MRARHLLAFVAGSGLAGCGGGGDTKTVVVSQPQVTQEAAPGQAKGLDASAKSDARNMVSQMESCYTEKQSYEPCGSADALAATGLAIGGGPGQVEVADATATTYTVIAHSESGNSFQIEKTKDGTYTRTCEVGGADAGGCTSGSW